MSADPAASHMRDRAIVACEFDTRALGIQTFRIVDSRADWRSEVAGLPSPSLCDVKIDADEHELRLALEAEGFRHVVTQTTLHARPSAEQTHGVALASQLSLSEQDLDAHARNFTLSRHAADTRLPRSGSFKLMRRWVANSLGGRREVLHAGFNVLTFEERGPELVIDLLSVMEPRRGHGVRLVQAAREEAERRSLNGVTVTTEASNIAALRTYLRGGFLPVGASLAMHRLA